MIICLTNFVNIRKHQETTFCKHDTNIWSSIWWRFDISPIAMQCRTSKNWWLPPKRRASNCWWKLSGTRRDLQEIWWESCDLMGKQWKPIEQNRLHIWRFMTDDDCGDCNPWKSIGILLVWMPWNGIWLSLVRIDDRSCLNFYVSILDP